MIIRDNFYKFCVKPYVVTPHLNRLDETVQMRGNNKTICCDPSFEPSRDGSKHML